MEYGRAVAAYAAAHGLAGQPLLGFAVPLADAAVAAVVAETAYPVDDLRIEFASDWRALVQAKRRLIKGKQFDAAVAQWVRAAEEGIDPARDRLVIVTSRLSESLQVLCGVLDRFKCEIVEPLTGKEQAALAYLNERLAGLDAIRREHVLRSGVIHVLDVEEPDGRDAREALLLLDKVVDNDVHRAWVALVSIAGALARRRSGHSIAGWLRELRGQGLRLRSSGHAPAAVFEQRVRAVHGYSEELRRRAATIDLRGLGAPFPPLAIANADCSLRVARGRGETTDSGDLLWTFLRRGRMVLTGLPGSGKSTSLAVLAAQLTEVVDDYVPVRVSLKDVDALDRTEGFGHRVLTAALRDVPEGDRPLLRSEFVERLQAGGIALLLDGLDETYERRGDVVTELEDFVSQISPDIEILLSTRDIAYAQAATLGWPEVRLLPPTSISRTVDAILRAAETIRRSTDRDTVPAEQWIETRHRWVDAALTSDRTLVETPLLPVLLTLLATERADGHLPSARASILGAVVADAVHRREAHRRDEFALGPLVSRSAAEAAMDAFTAEAKTILEDRGQCALGDAVRAVEATMSKQWGLAPGPARIAATDAVRFWDETGIFVITGATETVSPRLMLFAEIGDAMRATSMDRAALQSWASARAAAGSVETLVLAAGLSPDVCNETARIAVSTANRDLLLGLVPTICEQPSLDEATRSSVASTILAAATLGKRAGWKSWGAALSLAPTSVDPDALRHALKDYPEQYRHVGHALVDLTYEDPDELRRRPNNLVAALEVQTLPPLQPRVPGRGVNVDDLLMDDRLEEVVSRAAEVLMGYDQRATDLVIEHARQRSGMLDGQLGKIFRSRGFGAEADALIAERRASRFMSFSGIRGDLDDDGPRRFLVRLTTREHRPLTHQQRMRLDELAELVETLNLNDTSSWGNKRQDDPKYDEVIDLIGLLGGFDLGVIAAQAQVVLDRIDHTDRFAAFFALFDIAERRDLDQWDAVPNRRQAVELLVDMLTWTLGNARVAATALWETDGGRLAAPEIRRLLPALARYPDHQEIAAHVLASTASGPEPTSWLESENPILRAVAARWCTATKDGGLLPEVLVLLDDPDGHVRLAAIQTVSEAQGHDHDRDLALTRVARSTNPGWTCRSCLTLNEAGRSTCAKSECHRSPPDPAREAQRTLEHHTREIGVSQPD